VVLLHILSRVSGDDVTCFILFHYPSYSFVALFNENGENIHKSGEMFVIN
jgi:hypothetical protein